MEKPNCYKCVHRREIPGDAHSSCAHPDAGGHGNPMMELLGLLSSAKRTGPMIDPSGVAKLQIRAAPHGIKSGWFNWPWNFDPVWLENCIGFTPKKEAA